MARKALSRCTLCGDPIHHYPISITFFTRIGDQFVDAGISKEMRQSIHNQYCFRCAEMIHLFISGGKR